MRLRVTSVALLAEPKGLDRMNSNDLARLASAAARRARGASRSPRDGAWGCRTPGNLPVAARGRGGALRRQGRIAATARKRPLPHARAHGKRALEMLTQVHDVSCVTLQRVRSVPAGERTIKRLTPPYSVALAAEGTAVLLDSSPGPSSDARSEPLRKTARLRVSARATLALRTSLPSPSRASTTRALQHGRGVEPPWTPGPLLRRSSPGSKIRTDRCERTPHLLRLGKGCGRG